MNFKVIKYLAYFTLAISFYFLLEITLQYIPFNTDVAFLRIKQQYIDVPFYIEAFYIHVYTSIFAILAGFTQFSDKLKIKRKKLHARMGWLYIVVVLLFAAPSGLYIGIYANGGIPSQISFILLAILWFIFTLIALKRIKSKKYFSHKYFMIRSFSLALSAITLRFWKYLIVYLFHPRPMDVYLIVAWLGWILNLIIAEIIIYKLKQKE